LLRADVQRNHPPFPIIKANTHTMIISPKSLWAVLAAACLATTAVRADELDSLAGKWTVKKTTDEGRAITQVIEVGKSKFKFTILDKDGESRLYAEGDLKAEKLGPFTSLKFTNIKAAQSSSESLQEVNDDRTVIYHLSGDTLTVAANFDGDRNNPPALDKYTKSK
jgi:uncharacterized protein (TIGR03067 family)